MILTVFLMMLSGAGFPFLSMTVSTVGSTFVPPIIFAFVKLKEWIFFGKNRETCCDTLAFLIIKLKTSGNFQNYPLYRLFLECSSYILINYFAHIKFLHYNSLKSHCMVWIDNHFLLWSFYLYIFFLYQNKIFLGYNRILA